MAKLPSIGSRVAMIDTRSAAPPPKTADPIYNTPEHRRWRELVIALAHGLCQGPACKLPDRKASRLFADHIVELQDGGAPFDHTNGQALCGSCHSLKTISERAKRHARKV